PSSAAIMATSSNFYCEICKVSCNSDLSMAQHNASQKHKNRAAAAFQQQQQQQQQQPQQQQSKNPQENINYLEYLPNLEYLKHLERLSLPQQSVPQPQLSVPQPQQSVPQPQQSVPQLQQSVPQPQQSVPQPQDNTQTSYCSTCDCSVPGGPINWQTHLNGQQHSKGLNKDSQQSTHFHCDVCKLSVSGKDNYDQHLNGTKHRKNLQQRQQQQAGFNTLSSDLAASVISVASSAAADAASLPGIDDPYIKVKDQARYQYNCQLCNNKLLSGLKAVTDHCTSERHVRQKQQQQQSQPSVSETLSSQLQSLHSYLSEAASSDWLSLDRLSSEALAQQALSPRDVSRCTSVDQLLLRLASANRLDVVARQLPSPSCNPTAGLVENAQRIITILLNGGASV
ncbi:hypothetical protein BOX15_Mlig009659g1, partial [Macrostomum lignano]